MDAENVATEGLPAAPINLHARPGSRAKFDDGTQMLKAMHCGLTTLATPV